MIRKSLILFTILFAVSCAWAQESPATKQVLPPHLFTDFGTFEKVRDGWRCRSIGQTPPGLFRELQIGDVVTSIAGVDLAPSTPVGMLQLVHTIEFGLAGTVEVTRAGKRLQWSAPAGPQILASQYSFQVFRSTASGIQPGDVLTAIGPSPFTRMMTQVENSLTSLVTIEVKPGKVLHFSRNREMQELTATETTTVRLLNFDVEPSTNNVADTLLRGVNTGDLKLSSLHGRWVLLHFWATWCKPCIRHLPDTRELSAQPGLTMAAIGFADTRDRIAEMGAKEQDLKIYMPSPELQRVFAIIGIPFDVLLDPAGKPVLVVAGDMRGEGLKSIVMQYVKQ